MNDIIFEINDYLKSNHHIQSDRQFSRLYLNRSDKYWSVVKSTKRPVKEASILHLAQTLRTKAEVIKKYADRHQVDDADKLEGYSRRLISGLIPSTTLFQV